MQITPADVAGTFSARPTYALATSGNRPHDPRAWAAAVAAGMIGIDDALPLPRKAVAHNVRQQVAIILYRAFALLKPSTALADIDGIASGCVDEALRVIARTHWSLEASAPEIRTEFHRYIALNLADAAQQIKRLE